MPVASSLTFIGGTLMGLASSLHCVSMCGGVSSMLFLSLKPDAGFLPRARLLMMLQAGRILSYVMTGSIVGAIGAGILGHFDQHVLYRLLRTAAALALGWIGLTMTGFAPRLRLVEGPFFALGARLGRIQRKLPANSGPAAVVSGMAWGFMPCGMVYGALLFATMTGSAIGGARVMAGFGLGTVPAITLATFGVTSLRHWAQAPGVQFLAGVALIGVAGATVLIPAGVISALCGH